MDTVLRYCLVVRNQQSKTYHAEWQAWDSLGRSEINKIYSITKAKRAVRDHLPSGWTISQKALPGLTLGWCLTQERHIYLDRDARGWTVAHEIAHAQVAERGIADGHHAVFRWHYLALTASMFGSGPARTLEESFRWQRLRIEEMPTTRLDRLFTYLGS